MAISKSAGRLREIIETAIEDHEITRHEMELIMEMAGEDGHIDSQEQSLLNLLNEMIENREVRIVP